MKPKRSSLFFAASLAFGTALFVSHSAFGQTGSGWRGNANSDFQTSANWDNGFGSNYNLFFGQAWHNAGRTGSTTINNASAYSGYRFNFENITGGANQTFTLQGSAITLFDFGGNSPAIINNSNVNQIINAPLVFNSGSQSANGASLIQVNGALGGNLNFGSTISLDGNGGANANQLRIGGANGNTVTFGGIISNTAGQTGGLNSVVVSHLSSNITVVYNAANTYNGDTFIDSGTLQFGTVTSSAGSSNSSILRLGQSSANSPAASINLATTIGGVNVGSTIVIRPSSSGTQGTRTLSSSNTSGTNTFSGTVAMDAVATITSTNLGGTLAFTGPSLQLKTFGLLVNGAGNTTISNVISSTGGGNALTKAGGGTLTLSGSNTFNGGITIGNSSATGGRLVLDFANNVTVLTTPNAITFGGGSFEAGILYIKGKSTGTTTQTLGNHALANASGQSTTIVDNNGGSGTTLTLGNTWTRSAGGFHVFDVSLGGTINTNTTYINNNIVAEATLAPHFIKTATVTDFTKITAGSLAPLGATDQLPTSGGLSTDHRILSNTGTHPLTGGSAVLADTLRVDTTAGNGGVLDLGTTGLTLTKRTILFDGNGSYSVNGTTGVLAPVIIAQFSTGTVTINSRVGIGITKLGSGLLVGNFGNALSSNALNVYNGVFRAANTNSLPTTGNINLNSGGILELTTASGDIVKNVGFGGSSQVNFQGSGGFSAFDSNRIVAFGGVATPTSVTWGPSGTNGFLADGGKLILGSAFSGFTLDLRNAINLNGSQRLVEVNDGTSTTNVDGVLSGAITGTGNSGLAKTGTGTLALTNNGNTYTGATLVTAGKLLINNTTSSGTGTSSVTIASGATLGGTGIITGATTIQASAILAPGNGAGVLTTGATTLASGSIFSWDLTSDVDRNEVPAPEGTRGTNFDGLTSTSLSVASGAIFRVVLSGSASGDLSTTFWDQTQIWNNIFSVSGSTIEAVAGQLFNAFEVYNGTTNVTLASASQGSFSFNNSTLTWTAVPEPTSALAGLLLGAGLLRRRRSA